MKKLRKEIEKDVNVGYVKRHVLDLIDQRIARKKAKKDKIKALEDQGIYTMKLPKMLIGDVESVKAATESLSALFDSAMDFSDTLKAIEEITKQKECKHNTLKKITTYECNYLGLGLITSEYYVCVDCGEPVNPNE